MSIRSVLIVGASAAGLATAEALRRADFTGSITLLGDERHSPYDRPPLSKKVLSGEWNPERAELRTAAELAQLEAVFALGEAAESFSASARAVTTASGKRYSADAVVIATGMRPLSIPGAAGLPGVHTLRSIDDAISLRSRLRAGQRIAVAGNGVLGAEIASTAARAGMHVTLVGPQRFPMHAQLGDDAAQLLAMAHRAYGSRLVNRERVARVEGNGQESFQLQLESGQVIEADTVAAALGSRPATGWLQGSGLTIDDGVVCDEHLYAADGVWAVGDLCRWRSPSTGGLVRIENRSNAMDQARLVASRILGIEAPPYDPVPFFWTEQLGYRIQVFGTVHPAAHAEIVEGSIESRRFVARLHDDGRVTAVVGWAMPKQTRLHAAAITTTLQSSSR